MAALEARVEELQGVGIDLGTAAAVFAIAARILSLYLIRFTGAHGIPKQDRVGKG